MRYEYFDFCLHYNEKEGILFIEGDGDLPCPTYHNVSRQDIPEIMKNYLEKVLTNNIDVL